MKNVLQFLFIVVFLSACGVDKKDAPVNLEAEKKAVQDVVIQYHKAAEDLNFAQMEETLAENVIFYGTDSAETIKSRAEFQDKFKQQQQTYKIKYLNMVDQTILMDDKGTVASIIYGMPIDLTFDGKVYHAFTRNAKNLKKENGKWLICSGIVGLAATGPDYTEFLQKVSGPKDSTSVTAPAPEPEKDKKKK
jgi:hypothetical protein